MATTDPQPTAPAAGIGELLNRAAPEEYMREWTARVAAAYSENAEDTQSVIVFRCGEEWLALPTVTIREVAEPVPIHCVPHRGSAVLGIAGIRGELLLCVSLPAVLELPGAEVASARTARTRLLIVQAEGGPLAFPVDEVRGVLRYHPGDLRAAPATLAHAPAVYTMGLLPWQDTTVGCLDAELLFYRLNKSLA